MAKNLSDTELRIMDVVWETSPEPARFAFLMDALAQSGYQCQKNTLITLLRRLISKGYLSSRKVRNMNEYTALVDRDEFRTSQVRGFVDKYYEGQAAELVTALIRSDMLSADDYAELRAAAERSGDGT